MYTKEYIDKVRAELESIKDMPRDYIEQGKKVGIDMDWVKGLCERILEEYEADQKNSASMPEPAAGETVTKTTVSKSKDGGESALEKAVQAAGGFEGEGEDEGEDEDEDIVDMSDEGAGNLLKVLQSKF